MRARLRFTLPMEGAELVLGAAVTRRGLMLAVWAGFDSSTLR